MALEESLTKIREFLLERYKGNLAGILLFGTANTGEFKEGMSDIDTMIFLKEQGGLNIDGEIKFLCNALKSERFSIQYLFSLRSVIYYIEERGSFSTYITIVSKDGSRTLYSTPEFEKVREQLRKTPPSKKDIKRFIEKKDEFELKGYFKEISNFELTKALFSHIRRKLQIMNYFKNNELIFDYKKCINNLKLPADKIREIEHLYEKYSGRKSLTESETEKYYRLAKEFTGKIID